MQWFSENLWAVWLILAILFAVAEVLALDLTMLMLAGGALAGMVTSLILPSAMWPAQILAAVCSAIMLMLMLRPTLLRKIRNAPGYENSFELLPGSSGVASSEITASEGYALVNSDTWTARSISGVIPENTPIVVERVEGIVVYVTPLISDDYSQNDD